MDKRRDKHSFQVLAINEAFGAIDLNVMKVRDVVGLVTYTVISVDTTIKRNSCLPPKNPASIAMRTASRTDGP